MAERRDQEDTATPQESSILWITEVGDLVQFFEPEVNIAVVADVWRTSTATHTKLERLDFAQVLAPGQSIEKRVPRVSELPLLGEFIAYWADVLVELSGCIKVGVRVATLERAMCPRFHVDLVTARLVCTLVGGGTEFLAEGACERSHLGAPTSAGGDAPGLLRPEARVHAAPEGAMVCLKGELWPGNRGRGAVHRSPRACSSNPRLVLTLDALE